ncbi:MAG: hypothetical protein F2667_04845 [Actinobacteria bacterium]|uniref:Unannotated protein n=1 Tax=freshwater metagenome TaxID=449393 RepID=A0A6J6PLQ7_9ZZZZ|nr:hypothetical protein [Actinomycetota bacterium]
MLSSSRFLRAVVGLAFALLLVGTASPASAVTYGPYSPEAYGVKGRVSPPTSAQARAYVQFVRSSSDADSNAGERQVRITYKIGGNAARTLGARYLMKGSTTTFSTAAVPCGQTVRVTAAARGRVGTGAWSKWYATTRSVKRSC